MVVCPFAVMRFNCLKRFDRREIIGEDFRHRQLDHASIGKHPPLIKQQR